MLRTTSQAVLEIHKIHAAAQRRGGWVSRSGGLQMFGVPQQLLELQWSVSPGGRRAEAQPHRNRMEHEVTLKASQPRSTSNWWHRQQPVSKHQVNTSQGGGARWWLIWISPFSGTGRWLLHWCVLLSSVQWARTKRVKVNGGTLSIWEKITRVVKM